MLTLFTMFTLLCMISTYFHECGHAAAIRCFNFRLIRFSIGKGVRILSFNRKNVEYRLCFPPYGGSVHYEYNLRTRTPYIQQAMVSLSGPLCSFLIFYMTSWMLGFFYNQHLGIIDSSVQVILFIDNYLYNASSPLLTIQTDIHFYLTLFMVLNFFTCFGNLLPFSRFDGGHVIYALFQYIKKRFF